VAEDGSGTGSPVKRASVSPFKRIYESPTKIQAGNCGGSNGNSSGGGGGGGGTPQKAKHGEQPKRPVVIFVTGGAWIIGYKVMSTSSLVLCKYIAPLHSRQFRHLPLANVNLNTCDAVVRALDCTHHILQVWVRALDHILVMAPCCLHLNLIASHAL
jgi:hypothetical protein